MSNKKTNKKKGKYLSISIHKPVIDVLEGFCQESGLSLQDIGYQVGFIAGKNEQCMMPLVGLNKSFFYAGIYYANKHKKKLEYKYSNEKMQSDFDKIYKERTQNYFG